MADTVGSVMDKLCTVNGKMFYNQELLYEVRRMDLEQFRNRFFANPEAGSEELFTWLKKACDLNVQRQNLITEIDLKLVELMKLAMSGQDLDDGVHVQRQHKTY